MKYKTHFRLPQTLWELIMLNNIYIHVSQTLWLDVVLYINLQVYTPQQNGDAKVYALSPTWSCSHRFLNILGVLLSLEHFFFKLIAHPPIPDDQILYSIFCPKKDLLPLLPKVYGSALSIIMILLERSLLTKSILFSYTKSFVQPKSLCDHCICYLHQV